MTERDPELQRLIDESAIRNLIAHYPRALDRQDSDLLASLFHPDGIDEHGVYNGSGHGFVDFMRQHSSPDIHWTHHYGNQIIELDGNVAHVETYCIALCRQGPPGTPEFGHEVFLRLRYLDKVEKREGQWKISHRRVVYAPCHVADASQHYPTDQCLQDACYPADPVYNW